MTSATQPERPLRADARRNRERIIEAARAAFAEHGADAQMDAVAERAGVGVGTVYRHFPTKEALLGELVRQRFRAFAEHAREALASDAAPFEAFAGLLRRNAELMAGDAGTRQAVMAASDAVWEIARADHDELMALTGELVERAQRAGELRRDFRADEVPMLMSGVCAAMSHPHLELDWRRHLDILLAGLRARGG